MTRTRTNSTRAHGEGTGQRGESTSSRPYEAVLRLAEDFGDLPLEAIFKEDLLRLGVTFSDAALRLSARFKPKTYFIFSFDMAPLQALPEEQVLHAPEEIALVGGLHELRRTIVSVRLNPRSPYRVDADGDRLHLYAGNQLLCDVKLAPYPEYYRRPLREGRIMREVAPTIEWGYLIYLTVFRLCQYFGAQEECQFCDINENFRQQRRAGRPYNQVKELDDVLAALEIIDQAEKGAGASMRDAGPEFDVQGPVLPLHPTRAYTITGGSITSHLQGTSEVDFYCSYAEAIERRFPNRWISKLVVQAHEPDDVRRFKDAGVKIYHPNYEVWDARLFAILCAGKDRVIGRDRWIRRTLQAADVMGPQNVIPNFVAGVEMAGPHGFTHVGDALRSTGEGLDFFMSHGVAPRFTTWCPEPLSVLGRDQGPAPLEYHVGLLRLWRDTHRRHALPVPPGYGDPGAGKAVFSVSAFMDVLDPSV
ncbi:MAG: radical SAM protein [Candidatus Krumholzibacteriia bacterium]